MKKLNWGILGTGRISHAIARALPDTTTGQLAAIASRSQQAADKWGAQYKLAKCYGSYEALLADKEIDAVYITLPNSLHARGTVLAAEAGKHILCEKPLATNHAELMVMLEACRRHRVFFMEAFMWRCHPGTARWLQLIRDGMIGEVRIVDAQFSYNAGESWDNIRTSNALAGGAIMDVGCYCISAARLVAGAAQGRDFADPIEISGAGHVGKTGVDVWAAATLRFPGDMVANVSCGICVAQANQLRIWGSKGHLVVPNPWFHDGRAILHRDGKPPREIVRASKKNLYAHEAEMLGRCVREGRLEAHPPGMTWADSVSQQHTVDRWRKSLGIVFGPETDDALKTTITGRPLARRADANMTYGRIAGLDKPIARVVMGSMALRRNDMAYTCAVLDDYFERGGNAFDTAYVYGPNVERGLGKWIELRGVREQVVVIGKGAHLAMTNRPFEDTGCDPDTLTRQLHESLERLGTNYVDIYLMHRDNPRVPVGEFVDVLNEHVAAGRMRVFGGSNWTLLRIDEANAYAKKHDKQGFSALSNNFSLAIWNEPMWDRCLAASDPGSRAWLRKTRFPLFAWSSQASGFFTGRYRPGDRNDPAAREVVRVWFNDDNFERLARAKELARRKRCTPTQIALAYVLGQPLEMYALIGPQTIEETRTSLQALEVAVIEEELRWLNLVDAQPVRRASRNKPR